MDETPPQTAGGKVLLHVMMSLDGFVAGPDHAMDWMIGFTGRPGLVEQYLESTGAVLGGRDGWEVGGATRPYGGGWDGPVFILTSHPEDAAPEEGVTFLTGDPVEAVRTALAAAGGKNVEVHSPTIARQLLALGLVDEVDVHIAPVLLGTGSRSTTPRAAGRSGWRGSSSTATRRASSTSGTGRCHRSPRTRSIPPHPETGVGRNAEDLRAAVAPHRRSWTEPCTSCAPVGPVTRRSASRCHRRS